MGADGPLRPRAVGYRESSITQPATRHQPGSSRERNQGFGAFGLGNPEDTILRLSNGTPLFRPGALGPGVELISAGVQLWTIDAAIKYHGLSVSGEYFFRWLDTFKEREGERRSAPSSIRAGCSRPAIS